MREVRTDQEIRDQSASSLHALASVSRAASEDSTPDARMHAAALALRVEKDEDAAANDEEVREVSGRVVVASEEKQQLQAQVPAPSSRVHPPVPPPPALPLGCADKLGV